MAKVETVIKKGGRTEFVGVVPGGRPPEEHKPVRRALRGRWTLESIRTGAGGRDLDTEFIQEKVLGSGEGVVLDDPDKTPRWAHARRFRPLREGKTVVEEKFKEDGTTTEVARYDAQTGRPRSG